MKVVSIIVACLDILLRQKCDANDTFIGPGVVECDRGECEFSVDAGRGCSDPCHTRTQNHRYDLAFINLADVSMDSSKGDNNLTEDEQCYFKYAKNIDSYFPDQYVEIEEGCTARCDGCVFAPTSLFRESDGINYISVQISRIILAKWKLN